MPLYFAYGSNLCSRDLHRWCQQADFEFPLTKLETKAYLPDWEYAFNYYSNSREGGALNIQPRCGQLVTGALFHVAEGGWITLDIKEGAGICYKRREIIVLKEDGSQQKAITYVVTREYETSPTPPTTEYQQIVLEGLSEHQLEGKEQFLASAQIQPSPFLLNGIFVYGTLMRGESNFNKYLGAFEGLTFAAATTNGILVDFGPYPGLVLHPTKKVQGEFITYKNMGELLSKIDPLEGFCGYDQLEKAFYRRAIVQIEIGNQSQLAWTYILAKCPENMEIIKSGNWRIKN